MKGQSLSFKTPEIGRGHHAVKCGRAPRLDNLYADLHTGLLNQSDGETHTMIEVGAFEAKTSLSSLLEKVNRGEEVLITRRGKAVARMVPVQRAQQSELRATISQLLAFRREVKLHEFDWKTLRDQGRR